MFASRRFRLIAPGSSPSPPIFSTRPLGLPLQALRGARVETAPSVWDAAGPAKPPNNPPSSAPAPASIAYVRAELRSPLARSNPARVATLPAAPPNAPANHAGAPQAAAPDAAATPTTPPVTTIP